MIKSLQHAKKVHSRRMAAGKKGVGKAVRRFFRGLESAELIDRLTA